MRLFALLMLCTAAPAFATDQFDLACQGTRIVKSGGPSEPTSLKVHVDLAAKRWCTDACARVLPIVDATADKITLRDDVTLNTSAERNYEVTFNRKTNAYHEFLYQVRPTEDYLKIEATCTAAAFTPFPAPKP